MRGSDRESQRVKETERDSCVSQTRMCLFFCLLIYPSVYNYFSLCSMAVYGCLSDSLFVLFLITGTTANNSHGDINYHILMRVCYKPSSASLPQMYIMIFMTLIDVSHCCGLRNQFILKKTEECTDDHSMNSGYSLLGYQSLQDLTHISALMH